MQNTRFLCLSLSWTSKNGFWSSKETKSARQRREGREDLEETLLLYILIFNIFTRYQEIWNSIFLLWITEKNMSDKPINKSTKKKNYQSINTNIDGRCSFKEVAVQSCSIKYFFWKISLNLRKTPLQIIYRPNFSHQLYYRSLPGKSFQFWECN